MGLEVATYISQLNPLNPVGGVDPKAQGDDHIRLIKSTIQATFPNITGAITATHTQINNAAGSGLTGFAASSVSVDILAPAAGVLTTALRSDARLTLSQAIAPTWTGIHIFSNTVTLNGNTTFANPVRSSDGTAAAPGYSFSSDLTKGVYAATNKVGIAIAGVSKIFVDATGLTIDATSKLFAPAGTAAAPSIVFVGATTTGAFLVSAGVYGISAGGVQKASFQNAANSFNLYAVDAVGDNYLAFYEADLSTRKGFFGYGNSGDDQFYLTNEEATTILIQSGGGTRLAVLASNAAGGAQVSDYGGTLQTIGYRNIPQNSQSANYTAVLADAAKHILHPNGGGAGDTFTIPANASVAYDIGTVLTFVNRDSNAVSIAITTDTLILAGTTTTGTRTLAQNGVATAIKVEATTWLISGTGLS